MENEIKKISNSFINEAKSSPRMLEDLAAMERYMSENYDGRTFSELLQNADDALSTSVIVSSIDDDIIVANNGRPFNTDDIMAICRSGSSNKRRGTSIGYRGIGFKSATSISSEIIIHSANTFFTFSKKQCAAELNKETNKVPTIRIPFLYKQEQLSDDLLQKIQELKSESFTTFFIFLNANKDKFIHELDGFNCSWMLFLKNLNKIIIDLPEINQTYSTEKNVINNTESIITDLIDKQQWYIVNENNVSLAFKYDATGIVPCNVKDAVFHCFLPTIDKTGFLFIVNADFSTDPSRKHIILDDITLSELDLIRRLFAKFILNIFKTGNQKLFAAISLIITPISVNEVSSKLENMIIEHIRSLEWIPLNSGNLSNAANVFILPSKLSFEEQKALVLYSTEIANKTPNIDLLSQENRIDKLLIKLGSSNIPANAIINVMKNITTIKELSHKLLGKLFVYSCRSYLSNKSVLADIYIPLANNQFIRFEDIKDSSLISKSYLDELNLLNGNEKIMLSTTFPTFNPFAKSQSIIQIPTQQTKATHNISPINKWKTPIQNCIAIESFNGCNAKDVSKKNNDYQVISTNSKGETYYISVKTVSVLGDSFRLSEYEYESAQFYGERYKIYLFTTDTTNIKYTILVNPCYSLKSQKVIKEWEYIFESYDFIDNSNIENSEIELVSPNKATLNSDFDRMIGEDFEMFCAQLLIKNGYEDVSLTKASGDQGIDIIAYKDNIKYGFQCKCYSSNIGNDAVQEVFAGKKYYKCNIGILLTNRHFTLSAIELAESNGVILWGREELLRLIKKSLNSCI